MTVEQMNVALEDIVDILGGEVLGASSVDGDFRTLMLDADVALRELAWESGNGEWPGQLVDGYWELRAGESPDGRVRLDRLPSPYSVRRDDLRLRFDYSGATEARGLERLDRSQRSTLWCCGRPFYEDRELMDVDRAAGAARHEHLILVTVDGHYLQT